MKFRVNPKETLKKRQKLKYRTILVLFGAKKGLKRGHFSHIPDSVHKKLVNKVSWSHVKAIWENGQKPPEFPYFTYFCN